MFLYSRRSYGSHLSDVICPILPACLLPEKLKKCQVWSVFETPCSYFNCVNWTSQLCLLFNQNLTWNDWDMIKIEISQPALVFLGDQLGACYLACWLQTGIELCNYETKLKAELCPVKLMKTGSVFPVPKLNHMAWAYRPKSFWFYFVFVFYMSVLSRN